MTIKKCLICKKELTLRQMSKHKSSKYCSQKCYGISKIGNIAWNKGTKGIMKAWNKGKKMPSGKNAYAWKGAFVGYRGIHRWINFYKGKAIKCEHCGKTGNGRQIHWANINHKYTRNLNDYISLCYSCHGKYDKKNNLRKHS